MKKISIIVLLIAATACNHGDSSNLQKKKQQLSKMQDQLKTLQANISQLKTEIDKLDTTKKDNVERTVVEVATIKKQPFTHYVEVQGKVDSDHNINVSPQTSGTVETVYVKAGDRVKKGQMLIQIDGSIIKKNIDELQSSLAYATKMYNKQKALWDQKIGSEVQYLNAKNTKEDLEKKLATLQQQYALTQVKSPINGTVDDVNTKAGEIVSPGMPVVRIVNLSQFKVVADVAETYADEIKTGNKAIISFPDIDRQINSTIAYAGNVIDPVDRTFHVEVRLGKVNNSIKPNMLAILKVVDYQTDSAIVVPINAIQHGDDGSYVMIAQKKDDYYVAQKVPVIPGRSYDGDAVIPKGLNPGEKIITFGFQDISNGQPIQFKKD